MTTVVTSIVGSITNDELKISQFGFKLKKGYGASLGEQIPAPMNEFNENYLQTLTEKDMLAIQHYNLNFKRSN